MLCFIHGSQYYALFHQWIPVTCLVSSMGPSTMLCYIHESQYRALFHPLVPVPCLVSSMGPSTGPCYIHGSQYPRGALFHPRVPIPCLVSSMGPSTVSCFIHGSQYRALFHPWVPVHCLVLSQQACHPALPESREHLEWQGSGQSINQCVDWNEKVVTMWGWCRCERRLSGNWENGNLLPASPSLLAHLAFTSFSFFVLFFSPFFFFFFFFSPFFFFFSSSFFSFFFFPGWGGGGGCSDTSVLHSLGKSYKAINFPLSFLPR